MKQGIITGPSSMYWRVKCESADKKYAYADEDVFTASNKNDCNIIATNFCQYYATLCYGINKDIQKDYPCIKDFMDTFTYSLIPISREQYLKEMLGDLYD